MKNAFYFVILRGHWRRIYHLVVDKAVKWVLGLRPPRMTIECFSPRSPYAFLFIGGIAVVFYLLNLRWTFVGFYYDDADYVLGALSLLHGRYTLQRLPWHPLNHYRFPGFPLFLTPFVWIFQPHWFLLKFVSVAAVLACVWMFWKWIREEIAWPTALVVTALFAWNPQTLERAQAVMTEPLFLGIVLIALVVLNQWHRSLTSTRVWIIGGLAAAAMIVRPEGLLLTFAVATNLAFRGDRKQVMRAVLPSFILLGVFFVSHGLGYVRIPEYFPQWAQNTNGMYGVALLQHIGAMLLTFYAGVLANLPLPKTMLGWIAGLFFGGLGILWTLAGCLLLWRSSEDQYPRRVALCFFGAYGILYGVWPALDRRYLWALIPFVLYVCAFSYQRMENKTLQKIACLFSLVLLLDAVGNDIRRSRLTLSHSQVAELPLAALQWMQTHLDESSLILTNNPSMIYLYAGRSTVGLQLGIADDPAAFLNACLTERVTQVAYFPAPTLSNNLPVTHQLLGRWTMSQAWCEERPVAFEKVYAENAAVIYRVKPYPAFPQAYALYQSALIDLRAGHDAWGLAKLREAISEAPPFPEAVHAYRAASRQ